MAAKARIPKSRREGLLPVRRRVSAIASADISHPPAPNPLPATQVEAPPGLEAIWETEIVEAFNALDERRRTFLIVYIRTGVAAEAYRQAYNPLASAHLASMGGNQVLSGIGMEKILSKYTETRSADLLLVQKTYREMTEACKPNWVQDESGQWENTGDEPDWKARKDGADGLARLKGLNAPVEANLNIQAKIALVELPVKKPAP